MSAAPILHASCVAIRGRGVLLLGPSGAGKSDLALRLIDRGGTLVADDGVALRVVDGRLRASAGPRIHGLLEVRGLGLLSFPALADAGVALAADLAAPVPRMAEAPLPVRLFAGVAVPLLALAPFEASACVKLEQALWRYGAEP